MASTIRICSRPRRPTFRKFAIRYADTWRGRDVRQLGPPLPGMQSAAAGRSLETGRSSDWDLSIVLQAHAVIPDFSTGENWRKQLLNSPAKSDALSIAEERAFVPPTVRTMEQPAWLWTGSILLIVVQRKNGHENRDIPIMGL